LDIKGVGANSVAHSAALKPAVKPEQNAKRAEESLAQEPTPSAVQAEKVRNDSEIREYLARTGRSLDIRFDQETGYFITKVKAQGSGDIVRQIPSEEMLRISRNIDQMRGRLIDLLA
jgi:flagellar protein FlaG